MCAAAEYCEQSSTAGTACPLGHYCFVYTDDQNRHPVQPGKYIGTATGLLSGATDCAQGKYCPYGSTAEIDCPTGTYTASTGMGEIQNCGPCPAGSACPTAGMTGSPSACAAGHYCPEGTTNPTDYPCPPGTFTDSTSLTASSECTDCPTGKACAEGSTTATQQDCAAGYYCPLRTEFPTQFPCPAGKFTTSTSLADAASCTDCDAGKWCEAGSPDNTVDCPKNFYCPLAATSPLPCAAGEYSAAGASTCSPCTEGHICPEYNEETNPLPCPAGYYKEGTGSAGPCDLVPEGHYSTGTGAKIACADGQWTAAGGKDLSVCVDCPAGYYCASGVKTECGTGKYCAAGSSVAGECPAGSYCPDAVTTIALVCPAGTYSPANASSCTPAPGGYYTVQGITDAASTSTQCDRGFYCPAGSYGPTDETCDTNYYTTTGMVASEVANCTICPAGKYCLRGVSDPIDCPAGYYCPEADLYPIPCPKGTFRATVGAGPLSECTDCTGGKVCSQPGLTAPDKDCDAGYYCPAGTVYSRTTGTGCTE